MVNTLSKVLGATLATAAALNPNAISAENKPSSSSDSSSSAVVNTLPQGDGQASSRQSQPTTSPAVIQKPTGLTPNRDGVDVFLDSQRRLNDGLTEGAERARRLRDQVPGG